jgi:phage terminase small subunit
MKKLTRKQIAEGLDAVPMTQILLGSNQAGITLTQKQKAFATELVKTGNKSASYRKAYDHKGKPETAARDAQKVANNPKVATYIQALEQAKEAESYLLPSRLRSIAIHRLTGLALNEEIPPAQQLKALELIGKMTEVALFTERRELIQTTNSQTMREQLLNSIRLAISTDGATDVEAIEIDSLLDDISGAAAPDAADPTYELLSDVSPDQRPDQLETPDPSTIQIVETLPDPDPQNLEFFSIPPLHSNPLK